MRFDYKNPESHEIGKEYVFYSITRDQLRMGRLKKLHYTKLDGSPLPEGVTCPTPEYDDLGPVVIDELGLKTARSWEDVDGSR